MMLEIGLARREALGEALLLDADAELVPVEHFVEREAARVDGNDGHAAPGHDLEQAVGAVAVAHWHEAELCAAEQIVVLPLDILGFVAAASFVNVAKDAAEGEDDDILALGELGEVCAVELCWVCACALESDENVALVTENVRGNAVVERVAFLLVFALAQGDICVGDVESPAVVVVGDVGLDEHGVVDLERGAGGLVVLEDDVVAALFPVWHFAESACDLAAALGESGRALEPCACEHAALEGAVDVDIWHKDACLARVGGDVWALFELAQNVEIGRREFLGVVRVHIDLEVAMSGVAAVGVRW
eukprot:comp22050_c0_seq1/m.50921 comp22050_c0_seq1/g.50921  ORF comp22050_c0_seq1/g.50921 comp22050_c0_seq1/m.50921 type:complete len:305 (-) comp22050_c0_seq1:895-1809(-)